jgi:predicted CoA-substrate-specific enzyme activase
MIALGICLGATTITLVELAQKSPPIVRKTHRIVHEGNPRRALKRKLHELKLTNYDYVAVTGRKIKACINLPSITELEATEYAYEFVGQNHNNAIISAGAETLMVYALDRQGKIENVYAGNKCASGTGEFFLQQIKRMNLSVDKALEMASYEEPHRVAGRCSVFCKSDCTHALNKGIRKGQVTAGLCEMMAKKVSELLANVKHPKVMVVGGITQNKVVMNYLKDEIDQIEIPDAASYFEALGAALWALKKKKKISTDKKLFTYGQSSFSFLEPLAAYKDRVVFKRMKTEFARNGDKCVVGLDVGSTTTKAVILRMSDNAMLASVYFRTNGDPIRASHNCYRSLSEQIKKDIDIIGLGVTGSGRHIAGLHALTNNIINEIIAHSTAAVYFDKDVDTIFEIGGQDAKYTYITNSVPSDYTMNEACSAGTGSFLEEAAKEALGIDVTKIGELAMKGKKPPNFNDQCAAFISNDIKTAFQEGIKHNDIVAGLVYSVCLNYSNRVKGNRPVGKKVFMQGGVCYNKAVPIAMAALTRQNIIVPPKPGLMGAFGVALEIKYRLELGLIESQRFELEMLASRTAEYKKSFICPGGTEKCSHKCEIMTIKIGEKIYPFGGACDKYYNRRLNITHDTDSLNLVHYRQKLIFEKYVTASPKSSKAPAIGINKSFLTNTFYPLYYNFFTMLGMRVVLSANVNPEGVDKRGAAFCYPAEIAHGLYHDLLSMKPDFIFLPIITELPINTKNEYKKTCVFIQSEHAYLRTALAEANTRVLSPVLDFNRGLSSVQKTFVRLGAKLGYTAAQSKEAFDFAATRQNQFFGEIKEVGQKVLEALEKNPEKTAIVLFGRPHNAFANEANKGIPQKFATRGLLIIPVDFLPYEKERSHSTMYWGMGQVNLMAAELVRKHPQLFGVFITNFSCGPDSFIVSFFRDIMGTKPSLALELDGHTADAGLNTRIDAFLDITKSYRELMKKKKVVVGNTKFRGAYLMTEKGRLYVVSSDGKQYPIDHPNVTVLIPTMGRIGSEGLAAANQSLGINARNLPESDMDVLRSARAHLSCKECLPMQLLTGALLKYIKEDKKSNEVIVFFIPASSGPCRFGQYNESLKSIIEKQKIKDVAFLVLADNNNYAGFSTGFLWRAWRSMLVTDCLTDIRNALRALAIDEKNALDIFEHEWIKIKRILAGRSKTSLAKQIRYSMEQLRKIPLKLAYHKANKIALVGEVYVRHDQMSRQKLIERLAKRNIVVRTAPVSEFFSYLNYILRHGLSSNRRLGFKKYISLYIRWWWQISVEWKFKKLFERSGLFTREMIDIPKTIAHTAHLMNKRFCGEAILTTGLALRQILHSASAIISIGPFGCMPSRVAEALLFSEMTVDGKVNASQDTSYKKKYQGIQNLPFLAIETDGNPYPQIIEARLEALCLQSERIHKMMTKLE